MIISIIIGYKWRDKILQFKAQRKFGYVFIIIGTLMFLFNGILFLADKSKDYTTFVIAIILFYYGFTKIRNKKEEN